MSTMRLARSFAAFCSAPRPTGSMASSRGRPMQTPAERKNVRRSSGITGISSHLADDAVAAAETVQLDAHLLHHADEQVRQWLVVLAVEGDMAGVLEPSSGQHDRQVVARVGGGVPKVAGVQHHCLIEQ